MGTHLDNFLFYPITDLFLENASNYTKEGWVNVDG